MLWIDIQLKGQNTLSREAANKQRAADGGQWDRIHLVMVTQEKESDNACKVLPLVQVFFDSLLQTKIYNIII